MTDSNGASDCRAELGAWAIRPTVGLLKILLPVTIYWRPQPDITAYELARLIPIAMRQTPLTPYEVPKEPELLRHLEVHDPNAN
jgi:hypothetical protein